MDVYSGLCLECTSKLLEEINQNLEEEEEIKERLETQLLEAEQKEACKNYEGSDERDYKDEENDYDEDDEDEDDDHGHDYGYDYDMRDESAIEEDEYYQNADHDHYDEEE
jgi:hypothetical protein